MKLLIQRVTQASVTVDETTVANIGAGVLVFIGITHSDTTIQANELASKLIQLRIFQDIEGKMNESLIDQKGSVLVVSQFTLYADCNHGRRPSFIEAAVPQIAEPLYQHFVDQIRKNGIPVATGIFGAKMKVSLINNGPVTIMLESLRR